MGTVRIGLLDGEEDYVSKLSAYLNRMGKGRWNIAAFTEQSGVAMYLETRGLDILLGTRKRELQELQKQDIRLSCIWLSEEQNPRIDAGEIKGNFYFIYRYQSAKKIGQALEHTIGRIGVREKVLKRMVAVYSPIGRCGKTSLALQVVKGERYGKWLYMGMEDYSSFEWNMGIEEGKTGWIADNALYFIKQREEKKLLRLTEEGAGIIPAAASPFDTRQLEQEDIKWLMTVLQDNSTYDGAIFDIGTGMLQDLEILSLFDCVVIPYLSEKHARIKKENFEKLLEVFGLCDLKKRIQFLNMGKENEVMKKMEELFTTRV